MTTAAVITTAELIGIVGVSKMRVSQWKREGLADAAYIGHNQWDREAALSWIADRREDSPNLDGGPPPPPAESETGETVAMASSRQAELTNARRRLYQLQGDWQELRNRRESGELAYLDDMEGAMLEMLAAIKESGDRECAIGTATEQAWKRKLWHSVLDRVCGDVRDMVASRASGDRPSAPKIRHG